MIQPVVWKLYFTRDVSSELHRDMGDIESALGLSGGSDLTVPSRFAALQQNLLRRQEEAFGIPIGDSGCYSGGRLFDRQEAMFNALYSELTHHYPEPTGHRHLRVARLRREVQRAPQLDPARRRHHLVMVDELTRCCGFARETYGSEVLTQEHIAESLKRIRQQQLTRTWWQRIQGMMPVPVASRIAAVRAPAPVLLTPGRAEAALTAETGRRMQGALDELLEELEPELQRHAHRNPLHCRDAA